MKVENVIRLIDIIDEKLWFNKSALDIVLKNSKENPKVNYKEDIAKYEYAIKEIESIRKLIEKIH